MNEIKFPKPFLKWIGGKTQILDEIFHNFPTEINNYHEIFLGGGSVLFKLLALENAKMIKIHGKIFAYDINEALIYLYKNIKTNYHEFFQTIQIIIKEYNEINEKEDFYYKKRDEFNKLTKEEKQSLHGSSLFLFLNKTCFRGMFRIGPKGFNVPYGNYKNPEIVNLDHLKEIHDLIQKVEFICCDFENSLKLVTKNDFIYLDPPYVQENKKSFVKYTENGFDEMKHKKLFEILKKLKIKFMLSNSDTKLVHDYFQDDNKKFHKQIIICSRRINSKNPNATTNELLIRNYDK